MQLKCARTEASSLAGALQPDGIKQRLRISCFRETEQRVTKKSSNSLVSVHVETRSSVGSFAAQLLLRDFLLAGGLLLGTSHGSLFLFQNQLNVARAVLVGPCTTRQIKTQTPQQPGKCAHQFFRALCKCDDAAWEPGSLECA